MSPPSTKNSAASAIPGPPPELGIPRPEYIRLAKHPKPKACAERRNEHRHRQQQLLDAAGQPIGGPATATVAAGAAGHATTSASQTITAMPSKHFIRARATARRHRPAAADRHQRPHPLSAAGDGPPPQLRASLVLLARNALVHRSPCTITAIPPPARPPPLPPHPPTPGSSSTRSCRTRARLRTD